MKLKIEHAKALGKALKSQAVLVLSVGDDGVVDTVTWADSEKKCKLFGWWGQNTINACLSVFPFRTHFGWGNNGHPVPLTNEELYSLDEGTREIINNLLADNEDDE